MIELNRYDRIILSWDEIESILTKIEMTHTYDEVNRSHSILDEGVLVINKVPYDGDYVYYHQFSIEGEDIHSNIHCSIDGKESTLVKFIVNNDDIIILKNNIELPGGFDELDDFLQQSIRRFKALMYYVSNQPKERIHVSRVKFKTKSGKASKTKVRKVITLRNKIFIYDKDNGEKRIFNRITDTWGVRGHWRTLPSGERTWIKPHKKGMGEKEVKEYKLG